MSDAGVLSLALSAGVLIGMCFFGALWLTIRRGMLSSAPGLWFLASLLCRTLLTIAGFCLVAQGDWRRAFACLLGFLLARFVATRLARPTDALRARHVTGAAR